MMFGRAVLQHCPLAAFTGQSTSVSSQGSNVKNRQITKYNVAVGANVRFYRCKMHPSARGGGGGGELYFMVYIGMCRGIGYGF